MMVISFSRLPLLSTLLKLRSCVFEMAQRYMAVSMIGLLCEAILDKDVALHILRDEELKL